MSNTSNILFLSYDGLTDPLGQSQILPYLIGLAKRGYKISIVSFEKLERYATGQRQIEELCKDVGITWYPQMYHKNPPVLSTLYDLFVLWRLASSLVRKRTDSIVHCRSYLTALVGLRLKRKYDVRLIFDMRGFWADERIEGGIWSLDNPVFRFIYNYFKRVERRLVREADCVVVLTQAAKEEVSSWNLTDRIQVIPCCVDLDLFDSARYKAADAVDLRLSLGIGRNDFVLLYLGSLGTWYMLEEMLIFYRKLREFKPDARFLLLTPDRDAVSGDGIITLTVQRKDVPRYIAIADASICFIKPSFSKKGSSATKMAEVLAMNVPVVSNPGWGDQEFLSGRVNGLLLASNADNVPSALLDAGIGRQSQTQFFNQYFSLQTGIARYNEIYVTLSARNPAQ